MAEHAARAVDEHERARRPPVRRGGEHTLYPAPIQATARDIYVAAFVARGTAGASDGRAALDEPGVDGMLPSSTDPRVRLLVTDDRAYDVLAAALPGAGAGMVKVFADAPRCTALVAEQLRWPSKPLTAVVYPDLRAVPSPPLPDDLVLRRVRRRPDDAPDGVPLDRAVTTAARADQAIDGPPSAFAAYLRSLPAAFRLFAAVDRDGVVRATSGSAVFGTVASVMFVNTDPAWRGRGIGRAMTAAALCAGRDAGARHASLDATAAGLAIYRRLGGETVGDVTQFFRTR